MSGVKHDTNKPPMDLIDYDHVRGMAKVLGFGAEKYGRFNWKSGIHTSRLLAATLRHLTEFSQGNDIDEESGLLHLHHASVDLMMLYCMLRDRPDLDDRYKKEKSEQ